jgi:hypothetical protein
MHVASNRRMPKQQAGFGRSTALRSRRRAHSEQMSFVLDQAKADLAGCLLDVGGIAQFADANRR